MLKHNNCLVMFDEELSSGGFSGSGVIGRMQSALIYIIQSNRTIRRLNNSNKY